jgi:hypothetical protein
MLKTTSIIDVQIILSRIGGQNILVAQPIMMSLRGQWGPQLHFQSLHRQHLPYPYSQYEEVPNDDQGV